METYRSSHELSEVVFSRSYMANSFAQTFTSMIEILDAIEKYLKPQAGIRIKVGVSQNQMDDLSKEVAEILKIDFGNIYNYKGMDIEVVSDNLLAVNLH